MEFRTEFHDIPADIYLFKKFNVISTRNGAWLASLHQCPGNFLMQRETRTATGRGRGSWCVPVGPAGAMGAGLVLRPSTGRRASEIRCVPGGAGQRHGPRIGNPRPSPGASPPAGVELVEFGTKPR